VTTVTLWLPLHEGSAALFAALLGYGNWADAAVKPEKGCDVSSSGTAGGFDAGGFDAVSEGIGIGLTRATSAGLPHPDVEQTARYLVSSALQNDPDGSPLTRRSHSLLSS
jgi:hypothetical protein